MSEPGVHERLSPREQLTEVVAHLGHLLPGQGPIDTFVHHNTLHGLQHLPFDEAVAEAEAFFGAQGYLPVTVMRAHYRTGRISDADLDVVLAESPKFAAGEVVGTVGGSAVTTKDIGRLHLLHGVNALDPATLRFLVFEREATRRWVDDLPLTVESLALAKAGQELAASADRVGRELTLGAWLGELLGLDIAAAVNAEASQDLVDGRTPDKSVTALLGRLGVPEARTSGYLGLVDLALGGLLAADRDRARRVWLAAEARLVERVARRQLELPGRLDALERGLRADLEAYAVTALWTACVASFGLADPLSPTDPRTLELRDPDASIDRLGEHFGALRSSEGFDVPLEPDERAEVESALLAELEQLRAQVAADPARAQDAELREAASAAWFALNELGESYGRTGFEALQALARLRPGGAVAAAARRVAPRDPGEAVRAHAQAVLASDLSRFGRDLTHADLLARLTGADVTTLVNRYMIRLCAAFLDLGQAAWRAPDRPLGFYGAWRSSVQHDPTLAVAGVRGWRAELAELPDDPAETVMLQLERLGVEPQDHYVYLGRILTKLAGWAGMMNWWASNPAFAPQQGRPTDLLQYLAVRLTVELAVVRQGCQQALGVADPHVGTVAARLRPAAFEYYVRSELHRGLLPAILAHEAHDLERKRGLSDQWETLAQQAWIWSQHLEAAANREVADKAWRLFRLAQLAGWSAGEIRLLSPATRDRLLAVLDSWPEQAHRPLWLAAFERHYRDEILAALAANRGLGRWQVRDRRPKAQVVFCIDEREESMHRAFDELDPEHETFGAGGFFNMAMAFTGLDDHNGVPLCPAGVVPTNRVKEVPREDEAALAAGEARHNRRLWRETSENTYWELKRNAVSGLFLTQLVGLVQSLPLAGQVLAPWHWSELTERLDKWAIPSPATQLTVAAEQHPRLGFTLMEQATRIETQLRNIGLTHHFARLVVFVGHGSSSLNNPHESAHDCGACGGKHGAPNARAFAAVANRPAVREELSRRGIDIPNDTHFVGGVHNTASDRNRFFDTQDIPETHRDEWQALRTNLDEARALSARERCRRFDSAPKTSSLSRSVRHVEGRARDLSQVRPEWGHCTNAVAVVGRRALTQGLFLDRRTFVISYDPAGDPDGSIVQRILLAMGPVGAGINLEYYFSTVDNRRFGCDTKVPHNVTGLLGVMEGAASDLRTGLPKQMVELHEAMRLLLIVESPLAVLGQIHASQPGIAQLLDNEWVHLVAVDPADGRFHVFVPGRGFEAWAGEPAELLVVANSFEYYGGRTTFLPPARIGAERLR
jgi:uncharacterized protein YbcC (UPF0753/DUF2309 family)